MRRQFFIAAILVFGLDCFGFDPSAQDDSVALARHFVVRPNPVEPAIKQGSFEPLGGETITLMGGTDVYGMQDHGYLEAALQSAFPGKKLHFRNIGWPADTVYRQQRPMYFYTEKGDTREGSIPDQREKIEPGTFLLMFGRTESLDGLEALPRFEETYQSLIDHLKKFSNRLVLIGPPPFVEAGPALKFAGARQEVLSQYVATIQELAQRNGAAFIDLSGFDLDDFASDGNNLSDLGFRDVAMQVAQGLGFTATFYEPVIDAVLKKNHLWHQFYRPTNWGFLFGDRQWVPSSRDHLNSEHRWFVEELAKLPAMIGVGDEAIWEAAQ